MGKILIGAAALFFLAFAPAHAQWGMTQRGKFMSDCVSGCENNPNVVGPQKGQCGIFCNCLANEGEKMFTSADFEEMDAAARANRDHPKTQQFHGLVPACNQQAFGQ